MLFYFRKKQSDAVEKNAKLQFQILLKNKIFYEINFGLNWMLSIIIFFDLHSNTKLIHLFYLDFSLLLLAVSLYRKRLILHQDSRLKEVRSQAVRLLKLQKLDLSR